MKSLKFKPESIIEFEARLNTKGHFRSLEALLEAKKFLIDEKLDECTLCIGNFKTNIKPGTNLETISLQYMDYARNKRIMPAKIKELFAFELL
jgi:hypothetical protein